MTVTFWLKSTWDSISLLVALGMFQVHRGLVLNAGFATLWFPKSPWKGVIDLMLLKWALEEEIAPPIRTLIPVLIIVATVEDSRWMLHELKILKTTGEVCQCFLNKQIGLGLDHGQGARWSRLRYNKHSFYIALRKLRGPGLLIALPRVCTPSGLCLCGYRCPLCWVCYRVPIEDIVVPFPKEAKFNSVGPTIEVASWSRVMHHSQRRNKREMVGRISLTHTHSISLSPTFPSLFPHLSSLFCLLPFMSLLSLLSLLYSDNLDLPFKKKT